MIYKDDEHEYRYRNGEPTEILTVSRNDKKYPVVSLNEAGLIYTHTENGNIDKYDLSTSSRDLILRPEHDYPIDANVWVWSNGGKKRRRHFAGTEAKTGKPITWSDGRTKWTSGGYKTVWDYCELAE